MREREVNKDLNNQIEEKEEKDEIIPMKEKEGKIRIKEENQDSKNTKKTIILDAYKEEEEEEDNE